MAAFCKLLNVCMLCSLALWVNLSISPLPSPPKGSLLLPFLQKVIFPKTILTLFPRPCIFLGRMVHENDVCFFSVEIIHFVRMPPKEASGHLPFLARTLLRFGFQVEFAVGIKRFRILAMTLGSIWKLTLPKETFHSGFWQGK